MGFEQLQTRYKDKIPKNHSYPLGNKEISEALQECPQYPHFELRFSYQDCY